MPTIILTKINFFSSSSASLLLNKNSERFQQIETGTTR